MKKLIKVITNDGNEYFQSITNTEIGQPLNSQQNIGLAIFIAMHGFCVDPKAAQPVIVPPSQIKSIQLVNEA